jgi:hypothetical protein
MYRTLITHAFLLGLFLPGQAQSDCGAELRQVLLDANTALSNVPGHTVQAKVDIATTFSGATTAASHEVVTLAMGHGRMIVTNDKFSLFEDDRARVLLLPMDSAVYVYDKAGKQPVDDALRWMKELDLIQMKGVVTMCRRSKVNGNDLLEVSYTLPAHGETKLIKDITFQVNRTEQRPLKVSIAYHPGAAYAQQVYTYLEYALGKVDSRLKQASTALVMANNGLRPAYTGFKLHDLRKQPNGHGND